MEISALISGGESGSGVFPYTAPINEEDISESGNCLNSMARREGGRARSSVNPRVASSATYDLLPDRSQIALRFEARWNRTVANGSGGKSRGYSPPLYAAIRRRCCSGWCSRVERERIVPTPPVRMMRGANGRSYRRWRDASCRSAMHETKHVTKTISQ